MVDGVLGSSLRGGKGPLSMCVNAKRSCASKETLARTDFVRDSIMPQSLRLRIESDISRSMVLPLGDGF